jgi:type I restriction enzyme S subunit
VSTNDSAPPSGWLIVDVSSAGTVRLGRQRSPSQHSGDYATPYLRAGNITPSGIDVSDVYEMDFTPAERETYTLQYGDIVLTEASGSARHVGRSAIWRDELDVCCFQNTVIRFRAHTAIPEYAEVVFQHASLSGRFGEVARGIGILHLGAARFAAMPFPLPPADEQQRIVDALAGRLGELGAAREALQSARQTSERYDREVLAAAFSGGLLAEDKDAHETTAAPATEQKAGLQSRHPIPAGWRWTGIESVGAVVLGKALGARTNGPTVDLPYLRVANVLEDEIDFSSLNEMPFTESERRAYDLRDGDILLNEGQSPELVGRPAMYRDGRGETCFQNSLIRFRAGAEVLPEFALVVFRHYLHAGEFTRVARASTNIAHLSKSRFAEMPFPLPPLDEQRRIADEVRERLAQSAEQRAAIARSLESAASIELALLQAAVTGQLVPQDPDDEPASALVERRGKPPKPAAPTPTISHRSRHTHGRHEAKGSPECVDGCGTTHVCPRALPCGGSRSKRCRRHRRLLSGAAARAGDTTDPDPSGRRGRFDRGRGPCDLDDWRSAPSRTFSRSGSISTRSRTTPSWSAETAQASQT